ncbi:hypothetical protein GCM10009819_02470 [Agromyces tropicus]|uniref:Uncharacterized protein n=1 Tax=Agromyces tropicus TaxID=555371 RepID=A0ABN2TX69_9MICO
MREAEPRNGLVDHVLGIVDDLLHENVPSPRPHTSGPSPSTLTRHSPAKLPPAAPIMKGLSAFWGAPFPASEPRE